MILAFVKLPTFVLTAVNEETNTDAPSDPAEMLAAGMFGPYIVTDEEFKAKIGAAAATLLVPDKENALVTVADAT